MHGGDNKERQVEWERKSEDRSKRSEKKEVRAMDKKKKGNGDERLKV